MQKKNSIQKHVRPVTRKLKSRFREFWYGRRSFINFFVYFNGSKWRKILCKQNFISVSVIYPPKTYFKSNHILDKWFLASASYVKLGQISPLRWTFLEHSVHYVYRLHDLQLVSYIHCLRLMEELRLHIRL